MINADYLNTVDNTYVDGSSSTVELPELSYFDGEQYDFMDSKDYGKFLNDTERVVRNSYEYRTLINYLRDTEGMNQCSFLTNVTNVDSTKVKIEIHHSPLTLFDLCSSVVKKRLHNKESMDIFDCAHEVMWLHYIGWVGLIPVSATVHQMIHNQYIFVPTNIIRGNWRKFIEVYYDYIDPDVLDAIDAADEMTKAYLDDMTNCNNQVNKQMELFNIHQTYLKFQNLDKTAHIDESRNKIKNRITEIKSNKKQMYHLVDTNHINKTNIMNIIDPKT